MTTQSTPAPQLRPRRPSSRLMVIAVGVGVGALVLGVIVSGQRERDGAGDGAVALTNLTNGADAAGGQADAARPVTVYLTNSTEHAAEIERSLA
jgi:hypothetical protein